ncbi:MAG: hypothetical protein J6U31_08145 [Bacteroidales bacterium]|nr:hypothetical protein [Bacteroidales bacterium]
MHRPKKLPHSAHNGAISAFVKLSTEANDIALAEVQALIFLPSTTFYQEKEVEPFPRFGKRDPLLTLKPFTKLSGKR